jgi:ParB-like chromosome segregation protein Spo0J
MAIWGKSTTDDQETGSKNHLEGDLFEARGDAIVVPTDRKGPDQNSVSSLAEAVMAGSEIIQPIVVREVAGKLVLVDGQVRLAACALLGREKIQCRLFKGNEHEARLLKLELDLLRKKMPVLERANLTTEYFHGSFARLTISGQVVPKKKGRPFGYAMLAAQKLPVVGRSVDARKKAVSRMFKIATKIPPEVQKAAINAGLEDDQRALLAIANAGGVRDQLRHIKRLVEDRAERALEKQARRSKAASENGKPRITAKLPESEAVARSDTTLADLEQAFCTPHLRTLWAHAPVDVREAFIEMARRKRCRASTSVAKFLTEVFSGRHKVEAVALKGLAQAKGVAWKVVAANLRAGNYRRKKKGQGAAQVHYYHNPDPDWRDKLRILPSKEIERVVEQARSERVVLRKGNAHDGYEADDNPYYNLD